MTLVDTLQQMWYELAHTTKGLTQMQKPLLPGTAWYRAEQKYKEALAAAIALNTPAPVPEPTPVPTPTPAPAANCMIGAYIEGKDTYGTSNAPWDLITWDRFEANAGRKMSILHFGQPQWWKRASFDSAAHNNCLIRGAIPFVDYEADGALPEDILAGKYDAGITALANSYKNFGRVIIRWLWEMNQYGSAWFEWAVPAKWTATQHKEVYKRFVTLFRNAGATNVEHCWCINFIGKDTSRVQLIQDLWPGANYVDWLGLDGYNSYLPSQTFADLYDLSINTLTALAPGKPVIIGEFASRDNIFSSPAVKADWITKAFAAIKARPAIRAAVWFNWKIYENGVWKDWQIESSSESIYAFRTAIKDPYFV